MNPSNQLPSSSSSSSSLLPHHHHHLLQAQAQAQAQSLHLTTSSSSSLHHQGNGNPHLQMLHHHHHHHSNPIPATTLHLLPNPSVAMTTSLSSNQLGVTSSSSSLPPSVGNNNNNNPSSNNPGAPISTSQLMTQAQVQIQAQAQAQGSGMLARGSLGKRKRLGVWDKYDLLGQIGQGTYGIVFKAKSKNQEDQREYAIKKFKTTPDTDGLSQSACREIMLCRELKHENVISLSEVILDPLDKSIAMAFIYSEHDLLQILDFHREKQSLLSESMVKSILWQIINGVHYLHSNWVLHRDLKPANILIMGEGSEKGYVKIADLGLARLFQAPLLPFYQADRVVVTIWYRSPELLLGAKHYTKAVDVWSIGCIFAELVMGYGLFKGKEVKADKNNRNPFQRDQLEKIFYHLGIPAVANWNELRHMPDYDKLPSFSRHHPEKPLRSVIGKKISANGFKLLERMLEYDPTKRITAEEALDHPYFSDDPKPSINIFEGTSLAYPKRNVVQDEEVKKELEAMQAARKKKRLN